MDVSLPGGNTERFYMIYHLASSCLDNRHRDGDPSRPGNSQEENALLLRTACLCVYRRRALGPTPAGWHLPWRL